MFSISVYGTLREGFENSYLPDWLLALDALPDATLTVGVDPPVALPPV